MTKALKEEIKTLKFQSIQSNEVENILQVFKVQEI